MTDTVRIGVSLIDHPEEGTSSITLTFPGPLESLIRAFEHGTLPNCDDMVRSAFSVIAKPQGSKQ